MYAIYLITNTCNNKVYVGYSNNPQKRWVGHQRVANGCNTKKQRLHDAIRKYGVDTFAFTILESNIESRSQACIRERFWISHYDSYNRDKGYNGTPGGDGGPTFLGHKHTDDWKEHMSQIQRNRSLEWRENFRRAQQNRSEEWRHNISIAQQSRPPIKDVTKKRLREAWVKRIAEGKVITEEGRRRIAERNRGAKRPQATCDRMSDRRKLALLTQDCAITMHQCEVSKEAYARYQQRMNTRFWESYQFKTLDIAEQSRDLLKKLNNTGLDLVESCEDCKIDHQVRN